MNAQEIRQQSLSVAQEMGYPVNRSLPLLDEPVLRPLNDIVDRALCLHVMAACAVGFSHQRGIGWLQQEGLEQAVTVREMEFLHIRGGQVDDPQLTSAILGQVEALWALTYVIGITGVLDFRSTCHDRFCTLFPDLTTNESSSRFRREARLRPVDTVIRKLDLAYCLHWGLVHGQLVGQHVLGVEPYVIMERRRALEWCLYPEPWDEISLDT